MASRFDLAPRIEALQAAGLMVTSDYQGKPAKWLTTALADCDMHVLNCKGVKVDDTLCMVRLSKFEQLISNLGGKWGK
jgi:hypothetical protein